MKPLDDNGRELDAIFTLEPIVGGAYITLESRGGGEGGPRPPRNAEYGSAMELLLRRLGAQGATITGIEVYSSVTQRWPPNERAISLKNFQLPIQLGDQFDASAFRLELGRASAAMGRPDGIAGGNRTKRMRFQVDWPQAVGRSASELELLLAKREVQQRGAQLRYEPLGEYLRSQTAQEISLTLGEISVIIGRDLPAEAAEHQFWATTRYHATRRNQWLQAGYTASLNPQSATVRFERFITRQDPTADAAKLEDRVAAAIEELEALPKHLQVEPPGNDEVQQATTVTTRFVRDPNVVAWVLVTSNGICEACEQPAPFNRTDGEPFLEVHHIRPLAEGGPDQVDNALAVCPNCHRRFHHGADKGLFRETALSKVARLRDHPLRPVQTFSARAGGT